MGFFMAFYGVMSVLWGFYGVLWVIYVFYGDFMDFYGILWGFIWCVMGFYKGVLRVFYGDGGVFMVF